MQTPSLISTIVLAVHDITLCVTAAFALPFTVMQSHREVDATLSHTVFTDEHLHLQVSLKRVTTMRGISETSTATAEVRPRVWLTGQRETNLPLSK